MANAVTRRELAPVVLIEEVLSRAGSRVAGILDAIPGNVKRLQPELSAVALHSIGKEVARARNLAAAVSLEDLVEEPQEAVDDEIGPRSEEHTSELQSLMRISYAVLCLKKKNDE